MDSVRAIVEKATRHMPSTSASIKNTLKRELESDIDELLRSYYLLGLHDGRDQADTMKGKHNHEP